MNRVNLTSGTEFPSDRSRFAHTLKKRSLRLLKRAWENPESLGEESQILKDCRKHFNQLRAMRVPNDPNHAEIFKDAASIAWHACWRASDYSVKGLERRYPGLARRLSSYRANAVRKTDDGTEWYLPLIPMYDKEGSIIEASVSDDISNNFIELFKDMFGSKISGLIIRYNTRQFDDVRYEFHWCCVVDCDNQRSTPARTVDSCIYGSYSNNPAVQADYVSHAKTIFFGNAEIAERKSFLPKFDGVRFFRGLRVPSIANPAKIFIGCIVSGDVFIEASAPSNEHFIASQLILNSFKFLSQHGSLTLIRSKIEIVELKASYISVYYSVFDQISTASATGIFKIFRSKLRHIDIRYDIRDKLKIRSSSIGYINIIANAKSIDISNTITMQFNMIEQKCDHILIDKCRFVGRFSFRKSESTFLFKIDRSRFYGITDFYSSKFETAFEVNSDAAHSHNNYTVFYDSVEFSTSERTQKDALQNFVVRSTVFKSDISFFNRSFVKSTAFINVRFGGLAKFFGCDLNPDTNLSGSTFDRPSFGDRLKGLSRIERDAKLQEYEHSYRELKLKFDIHKASAYAAYFHRLEHVTKRMQGASVPLKKRVIKIYPERALSIIYDFVGRYGQSFLRPVITLCGVTLLTGLLYTTIISLSLYTSEVYIFDPLAIFDLEYWENLTRWLSEGLAISIRNIVRPFETFSLNFTRAMDLAGNVERHEGLRIVLNNYTSFLAFQTLSFVQSTANIVLIFLMLLGIRRRFQITG